MWAAPTLVPFPFAGGGENVGGLGSGVRGAALTATPLGARSTAASCPIT